MQLNMHPYMIAPHVLQLSVYINWDRLCVDMCQEKSEFITFLGWSPYAMISSEYLQLKGKVQTSLISPFSFKPSSKVDRINWSLSTREGTASGPLSTTPCHICQIRGISATREPRIGEERDGRNSHLSHVQRITLPGKKSTFEFVVILEYVAWS